MRISPKILSLFFSVSVLTGAFSADCVFPKQKNPGKDQSKLLFSARELKLRQKQSNKLVIFNNTDKQIQITDISIVGSSAINYSIPGKTPYDFSPGEKLAVSINSSTISGSEKQAHLIVETNHFPSPVTLIPLTLESSREGSGIYAQEKDRAGSDIALKRGSSKAVVCVENDREPSASNGVGVSFRGDTPSYHGDNTCLFPEEPYASLKSPASFDFNSQTMFSETTGINNVIKSSSKEVLKKNSRP